MELLNEMHDFANTSLDDKVNECRWAVFSEAAMMLVHLLSPFAPHLADELWAILGGAGSVYETEWPIADASAAAAEEITVVLQVNARSEISW